MATDGSARRVLSVTTSIAAMLDVTGTTVFRVVRPILPEPPPPDSRPDPFRAAMDTIMAAHREVVGHAPDDSASDPSASAHAPDDSASDPSASAHAPDDSASAHAPDDSASAHAPEDSASAHASGESAGVPAPDGNAAVPAPEESAAVNAPDKSGVTLAAWPTATAARGTDARPTR
jgi:hypothetical protein